MSAESSDFSTYLATLSASASCGAVCFHLTGSQLVSVGICVSLCVVLMKFDAAVAELRALRRALEGKAR